MARTRKAPVESKYLLQNGAQLSVEERLVIFANLIVDRIIEKQKMTSERME